MVTVSELMTKNVVAVRTTDFLSTATNLMWERDCGAVPVVDPATDRVVGMITDRDICMSTWSRDAPPSRVVVSEAMSKKLHRCSPSDSISSAEAIMRSKKIRRLPVLDAGERLVGILSLADIVRPRSSSAKERSTSKSSDELALTLAAICEPSRPASLA